MRGKGPVPGNPDALSSLRQRLLPALNSLFRWDVHSHPPYLHCLCRRWGLPLRVRGLGFSLSGSGVSLTVSRSWGLPLQVQALGSPSPCPSAGVSSLGLDSGVSLSGSRCWGLLSESPRWGLLSGSGLWGLPLGCGVPLRVQALGSPSPGPGAGVSSLGQIGRAHV